MIDREKVIKGLETCRTRVHCKECPYAYDRRANDSYCEAVLHNDVLELLKEQEPVGSEELRTHYGKMYKCKGCGLEWYQQTQRYCQHCGKAVRF